LLTQSVGPSAFQRGLLHFGYLFRGILEDLTRCVGEHGPDLLSALQTARQLRIKGLEEPFDLLRFLHGVVWQRVTASLVLLLVVAAPRV
jgi:hypothetical protein